MHLRRIAVTAALLGISILACSTVLGPAEPTAVEADTPAAAPLTEAQVLNAQYSLIAPNGNVTTVQFADGRYSVGADSSSPDYADIHVVAVASDQRVVFGDLNGDGVEDAAVIIAENYGGTGVFVSVAAVVNENGQPRHAASYGLDDRPALNAFRIENGTIFVDAVVHGPNDPGCCPAQPVTRTLRLFEDRLMLVDATSKTPDGTDRIITIDTPPDGAVADSVLEVSGTVTVSPFENTLGYRFYSEDGSELEGGPIMVSAPELGGPGSFAASIDLTALGPGPTVLVIADFSAADGSVLALDSVQFIIQ